VGARDVLFTITIQSEPGSHPNSFTIGAVSLSRKKSGQSVMLTARHHITRRVEERVELYLYSSFVFAWHVSGRTSPFAVYVYSSSSIVLKNLNKTEFYFENIN
jgi:hypothetical protein